MSTFNTSSPVPIALPAVVLTGRGTAAVGGPKNFAKSIQEGVRLATLRKPGKDAGRLTKLYPAGTAYLWGATPTDQTGNRKALALATRSAGDRVLFYAEGEIIAQATILDCFDNEDLATEIWGLDAKTGKTWKHIMALTNVDEFDPGLDSGPILIPLIGRRDVRTLERRTAVEFARVAHLLEREADDPAGLLVPTRTDAGHGEVVQTVRTAYSGTRVKRDTKVSARVKEMYSNACQVCGDVMYALDVPRSIGAHIRGLGAPHNGPDHISNILCLCGKCHAEFDWCTFHIARTPTGSLAVFDTLTRARRGDLRVVEGHAIDERYTRYHRDWCLDEAARRKA
ncbi:HNH endonuclease [Embleya scabrispora]|uniref:HNH endonuclease n=1 Tax=Embleya scabrispora TaxID=159449 RepID=UPI000368BD88|nr:HNH endonuclease [Embleya scabrispora]MYS85419.1 HNH endonuclease [Streptomyces sp. SID5474]